MNLSNDDLEDCVEKFRKVFLKHGNDRKNDNNLLLLIENLTEELNICKKNEDFLRNKVDSILDSESSELTRKYVSLEEKCRKLEAENKEVKSQFEDLNKQMITKLESQKNEFLCKIEENLNNSHLEITNLKNQVESDKICFESKEKEFYNELQAVQAANAIQYDELESNLKRQIVDGHSKLRQAQNTIRTLQLELNNLRSQQIQPRHNAQKNNVLLFQPTPIQKIKNNLIHYRQQMNSEYTEDEHDDENFHNEQFIDKNCNEMPQIQSSTFMDPQNRTFIEKHQNAISTDDRPQSNISNCSSATKIISNHSRQHSEDISKNPTNFSFGLTGDQKVAQNRDNFTNQNRDKFPSDRSEAITGNRIQTLQKPMNIEKYPSLLPNFEDSESFGEVTRKQPQSFAPRLHRGYLGTSCKKSVVPPLMQCSDSNKEKRKQQRKRKLYNPEDLESLEDLLDK
ncbi:hypothetical protein JTB14_008794 [Gonioctena quinquepunctata]|nr:hypothetical protein JTB14_008794 [Gonioctena quinquepunctata]